MKLPITKPCFGEAERRAILEPLETGWVVQGPHVRRFEEKFAQFTGSRHAAATSSCTSALHATLAALGVRPGDEVVVPAFTWVSTAHAVEVLGAKPVFCDVDLGTFNVDPGALRSAVGPRTVGLLPVHLFGLCADMDEVLAAAKGSGLWVVEDAACALGGRLNGRHAGTFGDAGCFSFHPRKSITTGEGGMVTTAREDLDRAVRSLRDHGSSRSDLERETADDGYLLGSYDRLGYNYRMTDLQGALGCAQMDRAAWILERRAALAETYGRELAALPWLVRPSVPRGMTHGYQAYVCLFRPEDPSPERVEAMHQRRNRVMKRMAEQGIATRPGTHAAALQPYYARKYSLSASEFPNAYRADRLSLALPLFPQMTDDEVRAVAEGLRRAFAGA